MIRKYKFTHSKESRVYLTSDTHFRHSKLIEQRGFESIEDHDNTLINNWNNLVRPQDTVIHLGDFVLGARQNSESVCLELFRRLNGKLYLLWGNHLAGVKQIYRNCIYSQFGMNFEELELYPVTWQDKVTFVGHSMLAQIKLETGTRFVFCSHFAYRIWIDSHKEVLHACGHSHSSDPGSNPSAVAGKRLDVGVDNFNFTPLVLDEFLRIMNNKSIEILDHHNFETSPSF